MTIKIDDLTIGEAKKLAALFSNNSTAQPSEATIQSFVGEKVIIRTQSAGVHYGELVEKSGKEVILNNSRRLWYWKTANSGISLNEVANEGLHKDSKTCAPVSSIWLEAIEIIPCTKAAIKSIEAQNEYKA